MQKPNYELKAEAINGGWTNLERKLSLRMFKAQKKYVVSRMNEIENGVVSEVTLDDANIIQAVYDSYKENELFIEAKKVNKASYSRRNRLNQRIEKMLQEKNCLFLTLTFSNDVLEKTSEETRRKYVIRFLRASGSQYVANIDYGKENEREHYHAVIQAESVNYQLWREISHSTSAINFKRVAKTTDSIKLAKYVVKLTNHAMKSTTKRSFTIYSRN